MSASISAKAIGHSIRKALPLLAGLFFIPVFAAEVGSGQCRRCHEDVFLEWRRAPQSKSCESCHGEGRVHVLAPTFNNVIRLKEPGFRHGPKAASAPQPRDSVRLELFVMSHCPYGVAAENELLPLVKKWGAQAKFKLYFIAKERGAAVPSEESVSSASSEAAALSEGGEKCQSGGAEGDGTDRFTSLHGLEEVLEDERQAAIQEKCPARLISYILARNNDLDGDWKKAAKRAGLTPAEIKIIAGLTDTHQGDSLFALNIAEGRFRKVSGSPTLFINGVEYQDPVAAYPVERLLCQDAGQSGLCRGFPECGFDYDCRKPGKSGRCADPGTPKARCLFETAARFAITIVNDETCPTCHTGNLVMEMKRRFPGAFFQFSNLSTNEGKKAAVIYDLRSYPSFLLDTVAAAAEAFKPMAHTFRRAADKFVLKEKVVQSYHLIARNRVPRKLVIFGSPENPPVIEMLRNLEDLLTDSLHPLDYEIHPVAFKKDSAGPWAKWWEAYESPYGLPEIQAGVRQRCVDALYPKKTALDFKLCRSFDVQKRFESHAPEAADEWKSCAGQLKLDAGKIDACFSGPRGKALFEASLTLSSEVFNEDPGPTFLVHNNFRIGGFNPAIRKILMEELDRSEP